MLIVFICLIAGPIVARRFISGLPSIPMDLLQPTGLKNNDTTTGITGSALPGIAGATGGGGAATSSSGFAPLRVRW